MTKKLEKRRLKKAKESQRRKQWELVLRNRTAFPEIIYQTNNASGLLVDEVKRVVAELIDSPRLNKQLRSDLNAVRCGTYRQAPNQTDLSIRLGSLIYQHLEVNFQAIHRMAYDIEFDVGRRNLKRVTVIFRALDSPASRLFCSPKRFSVELDCRSLVIAFHSHALERIGERTVVDPVSYADRGKTFAFPYRYKHFEFVNLANGQPAIKVWDFCNPSTFLGTIHTELLGPSVTSGKVAGFPFLALGGEVCYYLVGYCPVEEWPSLPGYLILKTLLLPGMENTPEFERYVRDRRPDTKARADFGKRVRRATYAGLEKDRDFDLIRLLNELVPQVKTFNNVVFDYPESSAVALGLKDFLTVQKYLTQEA